MAGTIIADFIRADANKFSINVGNTIVASVNSLGILNNTGNVMISSSGQVPNTAISGTITQSQIGSNVAATGPAFFAYRSATQSITGGVYTKVNFQAEVFDTANCYDSTTNYRFTPNVAGYYWFGFSSDIAAPNNRYTAYIYKNGSLYMAGPNMIGNGTNSQACCVYGLVYANGTTDYFEIYVQGNNSATLDANLYVTYFQGYLVKAA